MPPTPGASFVMPWADVAAPALVISLLGVFAARHAWARTMLPLVAATYNALILFIVGLEWLYDGVSPVDRGDFLWVLGFGALTIAITRLGCDTWAKRAEEAAAARVDAELKEATAAIEALQRQVDEQAARLAVVERALRPASREEEVDIAWYRPITLVVLAHAYLSATRATAKKGRPQPETASSSA